MIKTYFSSLQVVLLIFTAIFFAAGMILFLRKKYKLTLWVLVLMALAIFSFAALLDPFLNLWDERFHALVAKNMMDDPLKPTLYKEMAVNMAYDRWDRYHIWLHKQPLFLWQIALSFKLFGVSEFTLRLPNVLMAAGLVPALYRSGKLLVNERTGYFTVLIYCTTLYIVELVAGRQELEHNDFAFLAYVTLSIWSFIEYQYTGDKYWIYLVGLFSGMAILVKWLVGLLIYLGWIVVRVQEKKWKIRENKDILIPLLVTLIIALPWQLYIFIRFPNQAASAFKFNNLHFLTPLEGHTGTSWYHFEQINNIYGVYALVLIIPAAFVFWYRTNNRKLFFGLLSMVVAVYIFFTLAATKMPSFTIVAAFFFFISFAAGIDFLLSLGERIIKGGFARIAVLLVTVLALVIWRFDIETLQARHTQWKEDNYYSRTLMHNRQVLTNLKVPGNAVLFNVKGRQYIEAMFYTGNTSYNFIPSFNQYQKLKQEKRPIVILDIVRDSLPDYLRIDTAIEIIQPGIISTD